jgi:predicted nucleic acid-binding protein
MPFYQCDSSGLVKRYVDEVGSGWVRAIVDPAAANILGIADITRAEVTSALARRAREGVITLNERDELIQTFRAHCAPQYRIVPTQPRIIDLAADLIQRHPLRAYDAVQLACASIVNQSLIAHGLPPLIFVTADDRLTAAARGEAVTAENPNLRP